MLHLILKIFYKTVYTFLLQMKPHITMGCVKAGLLCDSSRLKPILFTSEWPHTECCYTELCNKNLTLPPEVMRGMSAVYIVYLV